MSAVFLERDPNPFSFQALYHAWLACRRGKRNTVNALRFELNAGEELFALADSLQNRTWQPSRSIRFVVVKPKHREVFAADFRDRIVHHLLYSYLAPLIEPKWIFDSYACREGKGTHRAVERLSYFQRKVTRGGKAKAWSLQLDIRGFFLAIDQTRLYELLSRQVQEEHLLWLARQIIFHDPTQNYIARSPQALFDWIPNHKTLCKTPKGKGLPIGNLTSQFFANLYLSPFDQWVKHHLKPMAYLRYMDDFILLDQDLEKLKMSLPLIEAFLNQHLLLELKDRPVPQTVQAGNDFLGYIVKPAYRLCRKRVIRNFRQKIDALEKQIVCTRNTPHSYTRWKWEEKTWEQLQNTLASYFAHFAYAKHYRLIQFLRQRYAWLEKLFFFDLKNSKIVPKIYPKKHPTSFSRQIRFFLRNAPPKTVCLFCVGNRIEIYQNPFFFQQLLGGEVIFSKTYPVKTRFSKTQKEKEFVFQRLMEYQINFLWIEETPLSWRKPKKRRISQVVLFHSNAKE